MLDDISNLLGELKDMALDMGSEIERLVEPLLSEVSEIARYDIRFHIQWFCCVFSVHVTQTHISSFCIHWICRVFCLSYVTPSTLSALLTDTPKCALTLR